MHLLKRAATGAHDDIQCRASSLLETRVGEAQQAKSANPIGTEPCRKSCAAAVCSGDACTNIGAGGLTPSGAYARLPLRATRCFQASSACDTQRPIHLLSVAVQQRGSMRSRSAQQTDSGQAPKRRVGEYARPWLDRPAVHSAPSCAPVKHVVKIPEDAERRAQVRMCARTVSRACELRNSSA